MLTKTIVVAIAGLTLWQGAFHQMPDDIKFTPDMLMEQCPTLQFIVDLTNTHKYYNGKVFTDRGLQYKKILTPGHVIPGTSYVKEFFDTVDAFLRMPAEPDSLIGVHCTHGLNRTSYFICCYMIHRMGFEPKDAIEAFEEARGHKIERDLYIEDLLKRGMGSKENDGPPARAVIRRRSTPYERPPGRERRRRSRWDDSAPPPPPPPVPAPYANPYTQNRGGPNRRVPYHNPYSNPQHAEKTFGYSNYGHPAPPYPPPPSQPYVYTEYPSHRGRQTGSSGSKPYDRPRSRGRGNSSRHQL